MLYDLEKETGQIEQILKDRQEYDPQKARRRVRISGGKVVIPSYYLSSEEAAEVFPERKALLESFLRNAAEDASYVRDCFLLRSTLQYAVIRKEITDLNCDYYVIRSYSGKLPSSNEIAAFLVDAYRGEENLTRDLLTTLANRYGAISLLDAVCDNPFLRGKDPDFGQAKKVISDAIVRLGDDQVAFRKDMSAIMIALDNHVLRDLGSYIFTAKKISSSDLSFKVFPLNEDKIEMLQFGQLEFSTYPEGKDEYLKALTGALDEAEEEGLFSASERCAITGEEVPVAVLPNGEEPTKPKSEKGAEGDTINNICATHVEQTSAAQNNQQINIINPSTTGQASSKEEPPTEKSDHVSSAGDDLLSPVPPNSVKSPALSEEIDNEGAGIDCDNEVLIIDGSLLPPTPERFDGKKKEFEELYRVLVGKYVLPQKHDEDNWCKLFMFERMGNTPLHKMEWLSTKEELRSFAEELYKPKKVPCEVNNVFFMTGKLKDVLKLSAVSFPTAAAKQRHTDFREKYSGYIKTALGEESYLDLVSSPGTPT